MRRGGFYEWLLTLAAAIGILDQYGERRTPWNIRDVWSLAEDRVRLAREMGVIR